MDEWVGGGMNNGWFGGLKGGRNGLVTNSILMYRLLVV